MNTPLPPRIRCPFVLCAALFLLTGVAMGQPWKIPAKQVTVNTSSWTRLPASTNTAQAALDYLNQAHATTSQLASVNTSLTASINAVNTSLTASIVSVSNALNAAKLPGTNIVGATYNETNKTWTGLMPGTNIVGATYNASNRVWTVSPQTSGFLPGTNIVGATFSSNVWTINTAPFITGLAFAVSGDSSYSSTVANGLATIYYPTNSP